MSPKVSVLMLNYNYENYIGQAIESVLNQSFADFEFIIIDDASRDGSWDIIQKYAKRDPRIHMYQNEINLGMHKTRNRLIELSQCPYIAIFDSDDISLPDRINVELDFLEKNPEYGMCGSYVEVIDKTGAHIADKKFPCYNNDIRQSFFFRNPFCHSTVMIRKECFEVVGVYDESFKVAEDLDMWVRIGARYNMYNIQQNLVQYRIHGNNSILKRQKEMIKNTLIIRKKALKLGYKIGIKGIIFYVGSWCMQYLPPAIVLIIFNFLT